jgi:hypothetical protein
VRLPVKRYGSAVRTVDGRQAFWAGTSSGHVAHSDWSELFARSEEYETTVDEIRETLAAHRTS